MKNYFIIFILPVLASAQMTITATERVSTNLKSDVLRGSLNFEEQNQDSNLIKTHLNLIVSEVKRFDPKGDVCHGGGYNLSPHYSYKDQKQEFTGYMGNLSFGCEFKTIDSFNVLNTVIDKITESGVHKSQGMLSWAVSAKVEHEAQNNLRLELLRKASDQASLFSKETMMRCKVASINFEGARQIQPVMMKTMKMAGNAATESPIQSELETSLEATVNYSCSKK